MGLNTGSFIDIIGLRLPSINISVWYSQIRTASMHKTTPNGNPILCIPNETFPGSYSGLLIRGFLVTLGFLHLCLSWKTANTLCEANK